MYDFKYQTHKETQLCILCFTNTLEIILKLIRSFITTTIISIKMARLIIISMILNGIINPITMTYCEIRAKTNLKMFKFVYHQIFLPEQSL